MEPADQDLHCFLNSDISGLSMVKVIISISHINCIDARCLINVVYLTACAFIRSG